MGKKTDRRRFTSEQKAVAVKRHLMGKETVSDICEELGIAPNQFYRWQQEMFENASAAFEVKKRGRRAESAEVKFAGQIESLEKQLTHKDYVIAEIAAECVKLKKKLGPS
jgi:transposase